MRTSKARKAHKRKGMPDMEDSQERGHVRHEGT